MLLTLLAAAALSLPAAAPAQNNTASPPTPAPKETAPLSREPKTAPRVNVSWYTGTIEALDPAAGTLTVRNRKRGPMTFKAEGKARKDVEGLKVGDKVVVRHSDGTALSIVKPGAKMKAAEGKEAEGSPKNGKPSPPARMK